MDKHLLPMGILYHLKLKFETIGFTPIETINFGGKTVSRRAFGNDYSPPNSGKTISLK
jgi:hypothetical protein